MRSSLLAVLTLLAVCGCAEGPDWTAPAGQPLPLALQNPLLVRIGNHEVLWDAVVDVVGDYFRIDWERPDAFTEGVIETFPKTGATIFEPWDHDSVTGYDRLESTLQSIRRRAVVRVIPIPAEEGGGFWVDLTVLKELENLKQPEHSTISGGTFRYDSSLTRVVNPEPGPADPNPGWIPQGRDTGLEQLILAQLQDRLSHLGPPVKL
jgi:hypothetical protein